MENKKEILLLWLLIIFSAEVLSAASQLWLFNPWSYLITFPLYLFHALFLLSIAKKYNKLSIYGLYFLWMIFALYESWITKVLWSGYIWSSWPEWWTIMWIWIFEFPILTFFWHPIMSFIVPILIFQIMTWNILEEHKKILEKTKRKTYIIKAFLIWIGSFVAMWVGANIIYTNINLLLTFVLIIFLNKKIKKGNIKNVFLSKKWFIYVWIYLGLLYLITFFLLLPEKIPKTIIPFLSILLFYFIFIKSFISLKPDNIIKSNDKIYDKKDLKLFFIYILVSSNFYILFPGIWNIVLPISYLLFSLIGIIIFIKSIIYVIKEKK